MKHLFYLILFSFCLTIFISCKKSTDAPAPSNNNGTDMSTALNKKWRVNNSLTRTTSAPTASDFSSFEFNSKGQYFIIKADKSLLMGNYTLNTADSIVTLFNGTSTTSQYGVLSISEITETTLTFKLQLPSVPEIDIITTAITTSVGNASSTTTNTTIMLAKAWKLDSLKEGLVTTVVPNTTYGHFILTEGGTYWTETYNGPGTVVVINNGQWKWSDNTNTKICGSSTDVAPDCSADQTTISFSANGNLIMSTTPTGQATKIYYFSLLTL